MRPRSPHRGLLGLLLLLTALSTPLGAERYAHALGFSVDLPAGFEFVDGDGQSRFAFVDPLDGMEFDLLVYKPGRFTGAGAIGDFLRKQLGASGQREFFEYEDRQAEFLELAFTQNGAARSGYAVVIAGRPAAGQTPAESSFALLSYTDADTFESYSDFILSTLDCFSIDRAALRAPGPVSQYLLPFPAERTETRTVRFAASSVELPWSADEASLVAETAGREYRVLAAYEQDEVNWQDAWARFYRMVYRESARRLDRLVALLDPFLPEAPTDAARAVLQWTQTWTYERDFQGIDFVDPLTAVAEAHGDCDTRAMVIALILERRGIDTILMLSRDYSHAMAAMDVPGGGQRFPFDGTDWLVGETTAAVGLGMIAQNQTDWKKWLGVRLGD